MNKYNAAVEDAKIFLNNYVNIITDYNIKGYLNILYDYIENNGEFLFNNKVNLSEFVSSYILYMNSYVRFDKMIDFDIFMQDYISNYMKVHIKIPNRQKKANLL